MLMRTNDLPVPVSRGNMPRHVWGKDNIVRLEGGGVVGRLPDGHQIKNALQQRNVRNKIARFTQIAIYPQQLTVPRQYATTREGVFLYKILKGRTIGGYQEDGVRVVVQENAKMARFVMSPLMPSEYDARQWAKSEMGVQ